MHYTIKPLGDQAVILEFARDINLETHKIIQKITAFLDEISPTWLVEYIPAFTTLTIVYSIKSFLTSSSPYLSVCNEINKLIENVQVEAEFASRLMKIPVLYGGQYGPDLEYVANYHQITIEKVIDLHTNGNYFVHMIGFSPGFPFISGLAKKITTPRKSTPRLSIPARSVGIAGNQTGIYPIETPGGWQIIGRTALDLFLPTEEIPSLLRPGDKLKFYQITEEEYQNLRGDDA